MFFKPYRPSIRSLQEEWLQRIARKINRERRIKRNGPPRPKPDFDMDNSEPWLKQHDSFADDWFVAKEVTKTFEKWDQQRTLYNGTRR